MTEAHVPAGREPLPEEVAGKELGFLAGLGRTVVKVAQGFSVTYEALHGRCPATTRQSAA